MLKLDTTDPAALAAWVTTLRSTLDAIHSHAIDATAPKHQRVHSRAFLRRSMVKAAKVAREHLDAITG
jgi:hypothetical protein